MSNMHYRFLHLTQSSLWLEANSQGGLGCLIIIRLLLIDHIVTMDPLCNTPPYIKDTVVGPPTLRETRLLHKQTNKQVAALL